jgi:flagella basal body P-ring formation protein FlgA
MAWHLLFGLALGACFPIEGDRILMRDLAGALPVFAEAGAEQSIGFAPAPGAQRRFSAGELNRLAIRNGIGSSELPSVCFERKLAPLTEEQVLAALRASLPPGAVLELLDFGRVRIPDAKLEFPRGGLAPARMESPRDPVIWRGRVQYAAAQSMPVWAKARVWISLPCAIAVEDLDAGKPIAPGQVRMGNIEGGPFSQSEALSLEQAVGLAPRRLIRAGQTIPRSAVDAPPDVKRGDMIGVEAHVGGALLKFKVRAEQAGRAGDAISVRNVESGKIFQARIVRRGWAAVEE